MKWCWTVHEDRWKIRIDKREWTVFQLPAGVGFAVTVGEFLEFERSFHSNGEFMGSSEIEKIRVFEVFMGNSLYF